MEELELSLLALKQQCFPGRDGAAHGWVFTVLCPGRGLRPGTCRQQETDQCTSMAVPGAQQGHKVE